MDDLMTSTNSIDLPDAFKQDTSGWDQFREFGEQHAGAVGDFFSNAWDNVKDWWSNSALNPGTWQQKFRDMFGGSINSATSQGKIAYTKSGIPYDETNIDSRINAEAQELANKRDDTAYSRLFADLKANGVNPAVLMSGASPFSSESGFRSNYNMTTKDQVNSALKAGAILALLLRFLAK